ncbi:MAG: archaeal flagella assembly protein J [uncultured archaeon A07HB70]|nr:MAG: archaeal flagella assembly protein J [uncultured archaeon A07HB70]
MASESRTDGALRELLQSVVDAYRYMSIPVRRYALLVLLPAVGLLLVAAVAAVVLSLSATVALPLAGVGVLALVVAVLYPKLAADRARRQTREQFHLFLTHITVLSTTNIDRVEVFRTLAQIDEYGPLAEEMGQITALVDTWNQSLDDACRRRSKQVASPLLTDFLERLSYSIGAGQGIEEFLVDEQESIIQEFVIRYESALGKLDVLKELYLSLMLSTTFILVFATVLPILIGVSPEVLIGGVVGVFVVVQVGFLFVINAVSPKDPIWVDLDDGRSPAARIRPALVVGGGLSLVSTAAAVAVVSGRAPVAPDILPVPIYPAVAVTPLLLPGVAMTRKQREVVGRDEGFPSFIRALGSVESVKQTSTANVLSSLRKKNFGELTSNVEGLYRRLQIRIDSERAWRLFAAETGSYLIHRFGDMYVVGRRMGGEPKQLGSIISSNIQEVLRVREKRAQAARTLVGVIYGITAASMFSAFIGLGIAEQMLQITEQISGENGEFVGSLFSTENYDLGLMELLLVGVMLVNALLSALMIRLVDRGNVVSGLVHFVLLTWLSGVVAAGTRVVIGGLIG